MRKNILILLFLLQITSCQWFAKIGTPFYTMTDFKVPDGTPAFQQGFKDGCSSSTYARSNQYYRNKYGYKYDPKMIGNSEYRFGHSRGYTWCFQQSLSGQTGAVGSWDRYLSPYGYDATFNSNDIGTVWGGFFNGNGSLAQSAGGDVGGFMGTLTNSGKSVMSNGAVMWEGGSSGQIFGQ